MFGDISFMLKKIGYSVTIERETAGGGDNYGGASASWNTLSTITASIQNITGNDIIRAEKLGIEASDVMYCNATDITNKDRIKRGTKYYKINYVDNEIGLDIYYKIFLKYSVNFTSGSK